MIISQNYLIKQYRMYRDGLISQRFSLQKSRKVFPLVLIMKIISEFIWDTKIPRIRKAFLQRPKSKGGMGLPNFQIYHLTSYIRLHTIRLYTNGYKNNPHYE